jgi:hypothetical protein
MQKVQQIDASTAMNKLEEAVHQFIQEIKAG